MHKIPLAYVIRSTRFPTPIFFLSFFLSLSLSLSLSFHPLDHSSCPSCSHLSHHFLSSLIFPFIYFTRSLDTSSPSVNFVIRISPVVPWTRSSQLNNCTDGLFNLQFFDLPSSPSSFRRLRFFPSTGN